MLQMCTCPKVKKHQSPPRVLLSALSIPTSWHGLVKSCVNAPLSPHPSFLRTQVHGCLCPLVVPPEPHVGETLTPQLSEERCVFLGFLGSPEVEVSSWHGQLPRANRLEAAIGKEEKEPDQPKIETQATSQSHQAPNLAERGPLDETGKENRSECWMREVVRRELVGNWEL